MQTLGVRGCNTGDCRRACAILKHMPTVPIVVVIVLGLVLLAVWLELREAKCADFIRAYTFPKGLIERLQ
jgi:hypothetical protein